MKTYPVTVTREDNLWVAAVHDDGLGSAAMDYEHLSELRDDIHFFIAGLADVDVTEVDVEYCYEVDRRDVTASLSPVH